MHYHMKIIKILGNKKVQGLRSIQIARKAAKDLKKKEKQKCWVNFGELLKDSYSTNQKLFFGMQKQMRVTKENSVIRIKMQQEKS